MAAQNVTQAGVTRLRVLHVIPSVAPGDGGPSRAIATIEAALTQAGVTVVTITTDHGQSRGNAVISSQSTGARRIYVAKWLNFYKVAPAIVPYLWLNVRSFDVVHVHALFSFTSLASCAIARWRGVPYIIRPLGTLASYGMTRRRPWLKSLSLKLLEGPLLRGAAAVHFTSDSERDEAATHGIALHAAVVPLGVEAAVIGDADRLRTRYPTIGNRLVVLFLSRLDAKKNVEGLLEAMGRLRQGRQDLVLVIAGDGAADYTAKLRALASAFALVDGEDVIWLGHVDGADKADAFAIADVYVLPSHSENFGIAAVEALSAGLPVILGRGVAVAAAIEQAGAGLAVAPEPSEIAVAIEILAADPVRRQQMRERARSFAMQEYSTETMASRLVTLYSSVVQSARSTQARVRSA
jgi:glycosyltransferase involved in cell wall biosynthesis